MMLTANISEIHLVIICSLKTCRVISLKNDWLWEKGELGKGVGGGAVDVGHKKYHHDTQRYLCFGLFCVYTKQRRVDVRLFVCLYARLSTTVCLSMYVCMCMSNCKADTSGVRRRRWNGICMNAWLHTYECLMSHLWMTHVTHMNASRYTYEYVLSHIWMSHVTYKRMKTPLTR